MTTPDTHVGGACPGNPTEPVNPGRGRANRDGAAHSCPAGTTTRPSDEQGTSPPCRLFPAQWTGRRGAGQAARFARLCDSVGVPLLSLSDVPGCLAGVARERGGIVRREAGPLYAPAEAVVPYAPAVPQKPYARGRPHRHELALEAPRVAARPGRRGDSEGRRAGRPQSARRGSPPRPKREQSASHTPHRRTGAPRRRGRPADSRA
ncbi:carboxyl transferase domain-containing protein [Streptomyces sp. NPDC059818]|uniref:carboxyl transferase domain-containing protein n=1 Tax=Streptomyces sp. NPDC059818 TaxID=3346962 RepID=UPI00364EE2DF